MKGTYVVVILFKQNVLLSVFLATPMEHRNTFLRLESVFSPCSQLIGGSRVVPLTGLSPPHPHCLPGLQHDYAEMVQGFVDN